MHHLVTPAEDDPYHATAIALAFDPANEPALSEDATKRGDMTFAKASQENLEAAVRLERTALADLQGAPLPSQ